MKNNKKLILPILVASMIMAPVAYSQVVGGGINVGGGAGVQGPANIGIGATARGDLGVRTDAVRDTSRLARGAAARAEAQARDAAESGMTVAQQAQGRIVGNAGGAASTCDRRDRRRSSLSSARPDERSCRRLSS